jgi:fructose-1,6-bisphosphatase/inositol monophosphatase family enzyme
MEGQLPRGRSGRSARAIAIAAARAAGTIVRNQFGVAKTVAYKGRGDIVTQADLLAEQSILELLRSEFPDHGLLSEESPQVITPSPFTWVIDPLDGTMNFSMGLPLFAVAIALTFKGEPVLGVVFEPMRRELFVAEKGRGATLGGQRISVSQKDNLDVAIGGFDLGYHEDSRRVVMAAASRLRPQIQTLRLIGSAVLAQAYVACGRFDLYFHRYLFPWDIAAARILLIEAGALVTNWDGGATTMHDRALIAATPALHETLRQAIALDVTSP